MPKKRSGTTELLQTHVSDLVEGITPSLIVNLLRDSEELSAIVLPGFRLNAQSVRISVVSQRLIREAEKDPMLVDALRGLWVGSNSALRSRIERSSVKDLEHDLPALTAEHGIGRLRIGLLLDERQAVLPLVDKLGFDLAVPSPETSEVVAESRRAAQLEREKRTTAENRASEAALEVRQYKRQVRDLDLKVADLERRLASARQKSDLLSSELKSEKHKVLDTQKLLDRAEKLADRLRRGKEAAEREVFLAKREIKQVQKELRNTVVQKPAELPVIRQEFAVTRPDWATAISQLVRSGDLSSAETFCRAMLSISPHNLYVHLSLEHVYDKSGDMDKLADECYWLATYLSRENQPVRASAFAIRALTAQPKQQRIQQLFTSTLSGISLTTDTDVNAVRRLMVRLKISNPEVFHLAVKLLKRMGGGYANALSAKSMVLHPDKTFVVTDGKRSMQLSAGRIAHAVDHNEIVLVEFLKHALVHLHGTKPALYAGIMQYLRTHDPSSVAVLQGESQPVVVDGSNVAWQNCDDRPRIDNILRVRAQLRYEGFYPVFIIVDASLRHQVDQGTSIQTLIDNGAILPVDSGMDADKAILEKAVSLSCPVVTNDRMVDWDPEGIIPKIRFSVDDFGVVLYLR